MRKQFIIAALLVAASVGAKAQTVTAKCPDCTKKITVWEYTREKGLEILQNPDRNEWTIIDYDAMQVQTRNGFFAIKRVENAEGVKTIEFGQQRLRIWYAKNGMYAGHFAR